MKINKHILKELNPCADRYKNFLTHYESFDGSFDEFIDLGNISYDDKIWVSKRLLNKNQLLHFGLLCVESVLNIFESKYPQDKRVRECIEEFKKYKDFSNLTKYQFDVVSKERADVADVANAAADAAAYAAYAAKIQQQNLNLQFLKMAASL